MCLVLYIGSDKDLPLLDEQDFSKIDSKDSSWPQKVIPFSVLELAGDEKKVTRHFNTKLVRYAGSFEGCGCGFNASYTPEWEEKIEEDSHFIAGIESRRILREYVEANQVSQIYACWSGDEAIDSEVTVDITTEQITNPHFEIPEQALLLIKSANKAQ